MERAMSSIAKGYMTPNRDSWYLILKNMDEYVVTIIKNVLIESCKSRESAIENVTKFKLSDL